MKKWWICLPLLLMFSGCGGEKDFETMADQYLVPSAPEPMQVSIQLPEDAAVLALQNETDGTIYLCDGYSVAVQTLQAGDLDATLRSVTGFGRDALQLYEIRKDGVTRYECVWASAGEGGDQLGKAVILDDGNYHYAITVLAPAQQAGEQAECWQEILSSAVLETD